MDLLERLAEQHIEAARDEGALDNLPGAGAPLFLDDDAMVPAHLRAAYRLLRNSGYLPEEVRLHAEIRDVEQLIGRLNDGGERTAAARRLSLLRTRLGKERCGHLVVHGEYYDAIAEKLGE